MCTYQAKENINLESVRCSLTEMVKEILKEKSLLKEFDTSNNVKTACSESQRQDDTQINDDDGLVNGLAERIINILITNELFRMQLEGLVIRACEEKIDEKLQGKQQEIERLQDTVEAMEQYSRRNCIIIHGLEQKQNEDTDQLAINFFKNRLKVNVDHRDLDRTHRLPSANKPLIVKFARHNIKEKVYTDKTNLRGTKMLVTESLTRVRLRMHQKVEKLPKRKNGIFLLDS